MKKSVCYLFIFIGVHSCISPPHSGNKIYSNSYQITKIDSIDNVYIIYALKFDTAYKILSLRVPLMKCRLVSVGNFYPLKLKSLFVRGFVDSSGRKFDITPEAVFRLTGISYYGTTITIDEGAKNQKRDLFEATNLTGLCFRGND